MNDEIKVILEALKHYDFSLDVPEKVEIMINKALDYITNLQQEINKLTAESTEWESKYYDLQQELQEANDSITWWGNRFKAVERENERLKKDVELFKSDLISCTNTGLSLITKIDKTIEYINKQKKKMYKSRNKIALFILMKLENILQNGSDDNE